MSNQDRQTNSSGAAGNGAAGNGAISINIGGNVMGQVAVGHQALQIGPVNGPGSEPRTSGHSPVPRTNGARAGIDLVRLLALLRNLFDEGELRDLFFELQVDYDALGGRSPHDKARELITYLDRRDRLGPLLAAMRAKRPEAFRSG